MDEQELKDSIKILLRQAPRPVQDFVLNKLNDFSIDLVTEYALHIDQGGVVEKELLLMLLGQESPSDFSKSLQDAGIPGEDVKDILAEVNEKVFKKLQQEQLAMLPSPAPASPQRTPSVPAMQVGGRGGTASPSQAPVFNMARPDALITAPRPEIRTMQSDLSALKHQSQQPVRNSVVLQQDPSHSTPARFFQTASIPRDINATPSPAETPQIIPSKPVLDTPSVPITHEYGSDPYREPIN